jgi:hypothetical protein
MARKELHVDGWDNARLPTKKQRIGCQLRPYDQGRLAEQILDGLPNCGSDAKQIKLLESARALCSSGAALIQRTVKKSPG